MIDLEAVRTSLLGSWLLMRWQVGRDDGRAPALPFGADALGLIVYSADGWMNASIARAHRPTLSAASVRQAPAQQQCDAFESYFNYAGPYMLREIDGAPHVVHQVRFSLNPNFVGSEQRRRIEFPGVDRLTLSADEAVQGSMRRHSLAWQRASA